MVLWRRELDFRKIKVWDLKMLLMVFWGSLGLILGALGAFLGGLLVLLRAFGGNLTSQNFFFGALEDHLVPRGAPNSPPGALRAKQMASRSHQEASGNVRNEKDT